ncbi:MAG: DUF1667 domain-containing protein [Raoultibacter sp.]
MLFATEVKTYTCICCPLGCQLEVSLDADGAVSDVSGNTCRRGLEYAVEEAIAPVRMVCAIAYVAGALEPLSVKTANPVPKNLIADVLAAIADLTLSVPVCAGDVVIDNVCGTGVSVIATKTLISE